MWEECDSLKIIVNNGPLPEKELDLYIHRITDHFPAGAVEQIVLDVREDYVDVRYALHQYRPMRKMGGYCIGCPEDWNEAKQAELRDTLPNRID